MKSTYLSMLLAFVILSCTPLKQASSSETQMPSLAVIGKQDKSLLSTHFTQIGEPILTNKIALSVTAIPFSKATFKTYSNHTLKKGENMGITYIDSVPNKPKYYRFEIKCKNRS